VTIIFCTQSLTGMTFLARDRQIAERSPTIQRKYYVYLTIFSVQSITIFNLEYWHNYIFNIAEGYHWTVKVP